MSFYIHAYDQYRQLGPMSLSAATSVVRATASAQRARDSRVWTDEQGKLLMKEAGCALDALWITEVYDPVVNIVGVAEIGRRRQQILWRIKRRSTIVGTRRPASWRRPLLQMI